MICLWARGWSVPIFPPRTAGDRFHFRWCKSGSGVRRFAPLAIVVLIMSGLLGWGVWSGFAESKRPRVDADGLYVRCVQVEVSGALVPFVSSETWLPDRPRVIGVVAGPHQRAYAINTFSNVSQHVVNDVIENTAVTVTHCPSSGCTGASLRSKIATCRWRCRWRAGRGKAAEMEPDRDSVMLLRVDDTEYFQDTRIARWRTIVALRRDAV